MSGDPHCLVVYYSRTGRTEAVARAVASHLGSADIGRIRPRRERSYFNWLARSFVPGSRVPIEPPVADPETYDVVVLGTPKWTLSCPPVNAYIDRVSFEDTAAGLLVTYGGFDERRFAQQVAAQLEQRGADVVAKLLVRDNRVEADEYLSGVEQFCAGLRRHV